MRIISTLLLICATFLSACAAVTPVPTTLSPESVSMLSPAPTPTAASRFIDLENGGFSLSIRDDLEFDVDDVSINVSDDQGLLVMSLNGRPYISAEYTLESFLGKYLTEMEARGGTFVRGVPYEIIIDDMSGLAVDLTGTFLDHPIAGRGIIISPEEDFIVFGLGMSILGGNKNAWAESGSVIFEDILASIRFKDSLSR